MNVQVLNDKGPFRLRDIDRRNDQRRGDSSLNKVS